jgi:hypothetical protein
MIRLVSGSSFSAYRFYAQRLIWPSFNFSESLERTFNIEQQFFRLRVGSFVARWRISLATGL